jgi:hypothetical protein
VKKRRRRRRRVFRRKNNLKKREGKNRKKEKERKEDVFLDQYIMPCFKNLGNSAMPNLTQYLDLFKFFRLKHLCDYVVLFVSNLG